MNDIELDAYLREISIHEREDLNQIKKDNNFKSIEETVENIYKVKKLKSADEITNQFDLWHPSEMFFKKHSRFKPVSSHKHNYIELAYVYSGEIDEIINNAPLKLKKGDLVILDTNVIHSINITGLDDILLNFGLNKEYFSNSFFSELSSNDLMINFITNSLYEKHKYNSYLIFHTQDNPDIHNIVCKLSKEFIAPYLCSDVIKDSCIKILFTELLRNYNAQGREDIKLDKQTKSSLEIINYISNNYSTLTLSSASKYFNFNPNYFSSYVKAVTGFNFKDLVLDEKLKKASYLLRNTTMPIEDICHEVNISNRNFFYKKFKERYNLTPKKYRF
ncbi:AraC family transcriptional regulator [Clostridium intestinale]|uniref:AraC family transcriptional regulator n=1 Tax=Clostridium intestinale TaxID=36845 RepID=UPI0028E5278A|nr:AraC family transcriptional regulator [Clostridium intestinale]